MNTVVKRKRPEERRKDLFRDIWGADWQDFPIWDRKTMDGFGTIPRTMPYINNVIDSLSEKGKPLSSTYFSLWCRNFDDGLLEIKNENELANESGFFGTRADSTWRIRMRLLKELGFIETKQGQQSEFQYVVLLNPFTVIKEKYDSEAADNLRIRINALKSRMAEVGSVWK